MTLVQQSAETAAKPAIARALALRHVRSGELWGCIEVMQRLRTLCTRPPLRRAAEYHRPFKVIFHRLSGRFAVASFTHIPFKE
jgi:hypothetical protein